MLSINVVLAQQDPTAASNLINGLRGQCRAVTVSKKDELRHTLLKARADVAVLDLEMFTLDEVKQICREFGNVAVVCVHRLADEELWSNVLGAGANDCFLPNDVNGILFAVRRNAALTRSSAA